MNKDVIVVAGLQDFMHIMVERVMRSILTAFSRLKKKEQNPNIDIPVISW